MGPGHGWLLWPLGCHQRPELNINLFNTTINQLVVLKGLFALVTDKITVQLVGWSAKCSVLRKKLQSWSAWLLRRIGQNHLGSLH